VKNFEDYPYDPKRPLSAIGTAVGLDKLRYVRDRAIARELFSMWCDIHQPARAALVSRVHHERKREEQLDVARRAHAGKLGEEEQDLALEVFGLVFDELVSNDRLRSFWRGLSALRQARANRATGEAAE